MPGRGGFSLSQGLNREIYQIIRKIQDEEKQYGSAPPLLNGSAIYDYIKRSNSSLKRQKKKALEDGIESVLSVLTDEYYEEALAQDGRHSSPERTSTVSNNTMNRSIVQSWAGTPTGEQPQKALATVGLSIDKASTIGTPTRSTETVDTSGKKRELQSTVEAPSKRRRDGKASKVRRAPEAVSAPPRITLADLGGIDPVVRELTELIALPMLYTSIYSLSGIEPPRGILLHGPPGCGKTMIANAFAAELPITYKYISAPSIVSGMSGESEKKLRDLFEEAKREAPCLIFFDEIDAITPKRESAQREMEKRIVAQMLTCMDGLALEQTGGKPVIIIAATNRPDSLDPALRRAGRFNKEINLTVPNEIAREAILKALTRKLQVSEDIDYCHLAKITPGFVGADLSDLISTAGVAATQRVFAQLQGQGTNGLIEVNVEDKMEITASNDTDLAMAGAQTETSITSSTAEDLTLPPALRALRGLVNRATAEDITSPSPLLQNFRITYDDLLSAVPKIQPSSKREGFATIPNTTWSDIGALSDIREELKMAIVEPIRRPERYALVGITAPTGVLLWGPPGCGKTLLAKAVANESRANFISVKGPELLNKYVGESERAVRQVFVRARSSIPCVIFFDELDALVPRREDSLSEASSRVVNTLLTELDGLSSREGIYVIAATNRPDVVDPAMLRPGRLETLLFVDLPGTSERAEILKTIVRNKKVPLAQGVDLDAIAGDLRASAFSGADLESLVRAAGVIALRRDEVALDKGDIWLGAADFEEAFKKVKASVVDAERYRGLAVRSDWSSRPR